MNLDELLKTPSQCEACGRQFKNVYSLAGHKSHCPNLLGSEEKSKQRNKNSFGATRCWNKGKTLLDKSQLFKEDSTYDTYTAKTVVQRENLKEYKCEQCGIQDSWNGKPLVLELDHANGKHNDHRLENLRFLCPNCHSQTSTFRGRNIKKRSDKQQVSDEEIKKALIATSSIRQALIKVGLSPKGGNYVRCHKLKLEISGS